MQVDKALRVRIPACKICLGHKSKEKINVQSNHHHLLCAGAQFSRGNIVVVFRYWLLIINIYIYIRIYTYIYVYMLQ